jgi:hypothetical protein
LGEGVISEIKGVKSLEDNMTYRVKQSKEVKEDG